MKRLVLTALLCILPIAHIHAQITPTSYKVAASWTAPVAANGWAGCTTAAPCTYVVSRATLAAGTTACPATTGTAYTPLNASSPVSATSYDDLTASGLLVCYIEQTEQTAAAGCSTAAPCVSQPSNAAGPLAVPATPGAPTNGAASEVAVVDLTPCPTCSLAVELVPASIKSFTIQVQPPATE